MDMHSTPEVLISVSNWPVMHRCYNEVVGVHSHGSHATSNLIPCLPMHMISILCPLYMGQYTVS